MKKPAKSKTSRNSQTPKTSTQQSRTKISPLHNRLGILGGGQLARMLALKAHDMGIPVSVLSESESDPAALVVKDWHQGRLDDAKTLKAFIDTCTVVTFESEFLNAELLAEISRGEDKIFPRPEIMKLVQDRLTQKHLLEKNKLPTAPYFEIATIDDARSAFAEFDGELVFKKRRFGYDGYGTFVVRSEKELKAFLPRIAEEKTGFIAEKFIPFKRELAVMVSRSRSGDAIVFPFVETKQENARCLWIKGPLKTNKTFVAIADSLKRFAKAIDYVGSMGVEFFETQQGLLINELAPRVHNSGHYSLDALTLDQFSAHVRSVFGMSLSAPQPLGGGFAMLNLLGSSTSEPEWTQSPDVRLHWYGKADNRAGRKMGHINAVARTADEALDKLLRVRKDFKV